jgi:spore maturation protein CgeB
MLETVLVREYVEALISEAQALKPNLFFVFKGRYVTAEAVKAIRQLGAVAVNFYPDVSFMAHGEYLPRALPVYDWVFTTKTFGLADLEQLLGVRTASFMPPSFDPEVHRRVELDVEDRATYECDVSFIGTWSPKKQQFIEQIAAKLPSVRLRVWGAQWGPALPALGARIEGRGVFGLEYAKATSASKINLAILSEARMGASSGDQITARTFQIPATGAFMLHERTDELLQYFHEGTECGCFSTPEDLVTMVRYYLEHDCHRQSIAAAGYDRAVSSGYSVDDRARLVLEKVSQLRAVKEAPEASISGELLRLRSEV